MKNSTSASVASVTGRVKLVRASGAGIMIKGPAIMKMADRRTPVDISEFRIVCRDQDDNNHDLLRDLSTRSGNQVHYSVDGFSPEISFAARFRARTLCAQRTIGMSIMTLSSENAPCGFGDRAKNDAQERKTEMNTRWPRQKVEQTPATPPPSLPAGRRTHSVGLVFFVCLDYSSSTLRVLFGRSESLCDSLNLRRMNRLFSGEATRNRITRLVSSALQIAKVDAHLRAHEDARRA